MLSSGFYNSKGGDRKYDAEQFGAMFNGLITDGVFAHYKDALKVTAGSGNRELVVKPGRAWFNGTWTEVDDNGHSIYLMGSAVETTYFVYLAVNKLDRKNTIAWYSNIANNDPEKGLYFYLLAQVTVPGGVTKISDSMITDTRGSDLCPYVTGIMETVSFEEIVKRVCGDNWQDWLGVYEAGITTGVQNAVAASERALDEVKAMKAYAVESEAVGYIWAKFEAVPTGGGGFEWATDSVHAELSDPPMPMCLFRDLSYADLGPGFKPSIALNSPYIAKGETAVRAIPAITQSKVWRKYPYFWEGGAASGTEVLRYDDLQRVVVNVGGTATEKYRYRTSRLMHIPVIYEPGAYIGTVSADNATAYPRDGYKDGYYYTRFASRAEDVSFYYPGLSAKNVRDAIIEVVHTGGNGPGTTMSVIEVEELPSTGIRGVFYIVKKPGDSDASEYLWLDRWEKVGGSGSGQNVEIDTTLAQSGKAADAKAVGDALDKLEEKIPSIEGLAKTEDIPDVPSWAMQVSKPAYTASEVGALPNTYTPPNQTAAQVGADPKGTAASAVSAHNTNNAAHNDIRMLIEGLTTRLNALANSTDTDLDQMEELVAYIKSNKSLIDGITTSKVSVSDIVNNLTTNVANKPLSAAQGVALKALIDAITIPTKLSQLTNDKGYITGYTETDPTVPAWAKNATKPSYSKSEVGLGNVDNVRQYSASNPPPYPVTKVNGKTGDVTVDVPTKVSQLQNDAKYLTAVTAAMITAALGYTPINPGLATLDRHEDGLLYLFVDGKPVGSGVELPTGGIDGYVDADKNIVVRGLDEGVTYKFFFELADGSLVEGGELVYDNTVYYTVTNTLTNCTTNNSATQVIEGESYSATITAKSGYELKSVVVTMGGNPVTVSGGTISIASVTGNVAITAVAEEIKANYTNLADPASADWKEGYRLDGSGALKQDSSISKLATTNFIACKAGDVVRIKGLTLGGTGQRVAVYTSNKANYSAGVPSFPHDDAVYNAVVETTGVYKCTLKYTNTAFIRFSGVLTGTSADVVITKNETI